MSWLDHTGSDSTSAPGGFFLAFDYYVDLHNSLPNDSIYETWQYQFGLTGSGDPGGAGILTASPMWNLHYVTGYQVTSVAGQFDQALATTLPTSLNQLATTQQRKDMGAALLGCTNPRGFSRRARR